MAIRFYDEALYSKIQQWVKDPNMRILKPDEVRRLIQITADLTNDKPLKLPIIALSRLPDIDLKSVNKKPTTFDGMMIEANDNKTMQVNVIPITIEYQIDIYTRYIEEGDEYLRNFVFNLVNYPKLVVDIAYNGYHQQFNANITLVPKLSDTSDIPQRLFPDQFVRWTIGLLIEDAYLFSVPFVTNVKMEEDVDVIIDESKN